MSDPLAGLRVSRRHTHRGRASHRPSRRFAVGAVLGALVVALLVVTLNARATDRHPMSILDEHVHLAYAFSLSEGVVPWRGQVYSDALVDEWICGVHHDAGEPVSCGDSSAGPKVLPSGEYSTAFIHYPTYTGFVVAWQKMTSAIGGPPDRISGYRQGSLALWLLGLAATAWGARRLGLRPLAVVAATVVPAASFFPFMFATMVNPQSTALLAGSLIAATGLLWVRSGRGFGWFLAATALASAIAVTDALPAAVFGLAMLITLIRTTLGRRRRPERLDPTAGEQAAWQPRWWQFGALGVVFLTPIIVWGRLIEARATIGLDPFNNFAKIVPHDLARGVLSELVSLHSPWSGTPEGLGSGLVAILAGLNNTSLWITVLVIGALVAALCLPVLPGAGRARMPLRLIAGCALTVLVLYPPLLRLNNAATFGLDFGIVDRYSLAFAPLFVYLVLLMLRTHAYVRVLATAGLVAFTAQVLTQVTYLP